MFTYNKYIRNPSIGLITLTTIVKNIIDDTLMYSESIVEFICAVENIDTIPNKNLVYKYSS